MRKNPTLLEYIKQCKKELERDVSPHSTKNEIDRSETDMCEVIHSYIVKRYCKLLNNDRVSLRPRDIVEIKFTQDKKKNRFPQEAVVKKSKTYDDRIRDVRVDRHLMEKWLKFNTLQQKKKKAK